MGYLVRYYGSMYGTLVCRPVKLSQANTYISKFSLYFCDLVLPYDPTGMWGTGVPKGIAPRSKIVGMWWDHKPKNGKDTGYYAKEGEFSISGMKAYSYDARYDSSYPAPNLSGYTKKTFTFNPVKGLKAGTTVYIGCYVPYDIKEATSRCGMAYGDGEGYCNEVNNIVQSTDGLNRPNCPMHTDLVISSAYTAPKIGNLSITPSKGPYDSAFTYTYSITKGTNNLSSVKLEVYRGSTFVTSTSVGKSFGSRSDKHTGGLSDNTSYKGRVAINDSKQTYYTNWDTFSTNTAPSSDVGGNDYFSPQNNVQYTWNTQSSSDTGDTFSTEVTLNGSHLSSSANGSVTLNASILNSYFSDSQRSAAQMGGSMVVTNTNETAGTSSTTSQSFTVQYQPRFAPTSLTATISNVPIIIQDTSSVSLSWSYPHTSWAAGWVNGYKVGIYTDESCTGTAYNLFTLSNSTPGSGNSITLSTKNDLRRGKMNYAKITPYYSKPNGGIIEGTQSAIIALVKPVSRINTPSIAYPINGSNWHNKYFRILLQLPYDDDIDYIIQDESMSSSNNYKYAEIQVKINGVTYSYNSNSNMFSCIDPYYMRKIAIKPSALTSFFDTTNYSISIRVKKNYYTENLSDNKLWSYWSPTINISNTPVNRQTFIANQTQIMASHYQYVHNASIRLYNTYPILSKDSRNIDQSVGDQVDRSEYDGIYQTILAIKNGVNGYCTYDNSNIRFNNPITTFDNEPTKQEFITANDKVTTVGKEGRNYKNLLVDDMNKLK